MVPAGEAEMSPASPITAAATAGPTPKISVTVVPEARTATTSLCWTSRRWISMRRRSVRYCSASTQRTAPAASAGSAASRIRAAWPAVIRLLTPPGISSHSTACSRQTTWFRARLRSRCRLAQIFSTMA